MTAHSGGPACRVPAEYLWPPISTSKVPRFQELLSCRDPSELGPAGGLFVPTGRTRTFGSVKTTSSITLRDLPFPPACCQPGVCPGALSPSDRTRAWLDGRNMLAALPPRHGSSPWITVNLASTDRGAIARTQDCPPGLRGRATYHHRIAPRLKWALPGRPCGDHNLSIISWSHAVDEQSQLGLADTTPQVPLVSSSRTSVMAAARSDIVCGALGT